MRILIFSITLLSFAASGVKAQGYQTPSPGKSIVYFARTPGAGALINFKYFDGEKYLGKFNGTNYMIYECDPGEHIFWVAAENRRFIEGSLQPDKVYIVEVRPTMGAMKAAVKIFPVEKGDGKAMKRVTKLLDKKPPKLTVNTESENTEAEELAFFIKTGMEKYNRDKEEGKQFPQLTPEMIHN